MGVLPLNPPAATDPQQNQLPETSKKQHVNVQQNLESSYSVNQQIPDTQKGDTMQFINDGTPKQQEQN
ncbi:hypothetical protein PIB30_065315, partial [Stylosanthes scabra]|nr:hypothetical protein [Stylosanthes scabra]